MRGRGASTPIRTLFVANRGEIAARIARTCAHLGIAAVIPPTGPDGPASLDLLDPDAVVAAALAARADALHPGYGFLAERASFASSVEAAGIRWVGPPASAIAAMGDKAAARRLATSLGVPVVPGYDDADQSDEALRAAAERIGCPVLVKPAAGGGGKGMRVVGSLDDLPGALAAARREARGAFGDGRLILERFLDGPRHVEVQVLFDRHGEGVHLGERDCSLQRRHQKVLEESPSPAVGDALRRRLGSAAVRLAAAVGYASAGTVEFLLADDGSFHFLEMNTRLQVEHPVTEAVTGRDLVADQLRIAEGASLADLGARQATIAGALRRGGHAVESRVYAEDPLVGFLPATGRVRRVCWPDPTPGIRVDAGVAPGDAIGARFDPLLAKVIAHGRSRDEALDRLAAALARTEVLGVVTNVGFLRWLVARPVLRAGEARIDTLERIWDEAARASLGAIPDAAWRTAARLLVGARPVADPWSGGWRLNAPAVVRVTAEGLERAVAVPAEIGLQTAAGAETEQPLTGVVDEDGAHLSVHGRSTAFRLAPPPDVDRAVRAAVAHRAGGARHVEAPMPGLVVAVHVAPGASVSPGDPLVTLGAMKMEHVIAAPGAGRVAGITVRPGDQVVRGQRLASLEP